MRLHKPLRFPLKSLFLLGPIVFCFFSCSDNSGYLPGYSGNIGEVLIVMEPRFWDSSAGLTVKNNLGKAHYGLPQDEPIFSLVQVGPRDFESIFKTHRNILMIDFSKKQDSVISEIKMNSWAKGQLLIKITAPDEESFREFMNKYEENIISKINQVELERQREKNKIQGKIHQKTINKTSPVNFAITLQKDAYIAGEDSNFFWIRVERGRNLGGYEHQVSQGVFIYWQPYSDTLSLSPEKIIFNNDSVMKKHIKGSLEKSFMITSFKADPPQSKKISFKGEYAVEIRGLWRMENDFMGGPFICLSFVNEKNGLHITAVGYVFAPQFDKLQYLREVEAMVKSINFPGKQQGV